MGAFRTGNPTLTEKAFRGLALQPGAKTMTLGGTVNKTFVMLALVVAGGAVAWHYAEFLMPVIWAPAILAFLVALPICFKKEWSPVLAPIYAVLEGIALGAISLFYELRYPGIVVQAVGLTLGVLFSLLGVYRIGIIQPTQNFRLGVAAGTGALALFYVIAFGLSFFGIQMPLIHDSGWLGIGFSVLVVCLAAANLVLDFDFIEQGAANGAPKYMEWYGAFGLTVTLVWLYLEILRLLSKGRSRR